MADFAYSPDFNYKVKPRYNVLTSTFENKTEQSRLKSSKKLRAYELNFTNRPQAEMNAVNTFFDTKKGSLTAFTVNIEGVDVLGKFVEDSFFYQRVASAVYSYGFNFQEVANAG